MNKKPKNIEQLFSESFNNFHLEPSSGLWKSISTKLAWRNFFSFNPSTLNAWYVAGLLAITTAGALLLTNPTPKTTSETKEITINNTIEKAVITSVQDESQKVEAESQKEEGRGQKAEARIKKQEANNQKPKTGINEQATSNQKPASSSVVLTKEDNPKLVTRIVSRSEAKVDNPKLETLDPELATPHPTPKTQNPLNQQPETSNQSPDPWPNTMDSLFPNNTPTPPQHTIQFPNAFTPNSNGPTNGYYTPGLPNNDVFHPVYKGVVEYHLSIFNRRGELIFECNDINIGWDGYINNRLAAQGVYVWKARGKYSNGQNFIKAGNVMLIIK